ncbi:hypothetical protein COOONC_15049 [Cooperia oncophora]
MKSAALQSLMLATQINSMIAQLAETQSAGEVEKLKSDNKEMKRRLDELESSSARESSRLEADLQKARHDVEVARHQNERERRKIPRGFGRDQKGAAYEVRRVTITDASDTVVQDNANAERLKEENQQLTNLLNDTEAALATAKRDLEKKNAEISELIRSAEDSAASSDQLEMFEKKLSNAEKVLQQEIASKVSCSTC